MSDGSGSERSGAPQPGAGMDELLGAFALDAVDPDERELIERHLAADPVARAEVDEMRETAAALASLPADDEGAPPGLWGRIADAIGAPTSESESESPTVVPLRRPPRFSSVPARVFMPIAAAAAIVIAVLALQVGTRTPNRAGDLAAAYNHAVDHGASTVALQPDLGKGLVTAEIALQPDGTGYLRNEHLAALPAGETYQLWAVVQHGNAQQAISAGVLGRQPRAAAFHVAGAPDAFAITIEAAPGVVTPTKTPVAIGKVSA
jgi:Anti-sigma-K factor rskA